VRSLGVRFFKIIVIISWILFFSSCAEEDTGQVVDRRIINTNAFESISAGNEHTCGIDNMTAAGQLKCWGSNDHGQLGNGNQIDSLSPQVIDGNQGYKKVVVGSAHTCGLTTGNLVKCWGRNNFGQLGTGNNTDAHIPVSVDGAVQYKDVSTAGTSTCAVTQAGLLKCWGNNNFGVLGDGTTLNRDAPVVIDSSVSYKTVSVGELHTCAITEADVLKCWGHNAFYELGDGTAATRFLPVIIDSGTSYLKIAPSKVSSYHTCGITLAGKLKCWGNNDYGQLGDSTLMSRAVPTLINAMNFYTDVSTGFVHSCAVEADSQKLFCWGKNDFGQLGDYTFQQRNIPTEADTSQKIVKFSVGYNYTCGITNDGFLRCYGSNTQGQIGNGTIIDVSIPTIIN
jgi:alpha-tubulin suppressor-like RCC1 family protein